MTNNIYPPDHLLRKWESLIIDEEQNVDVVLYEAFQAGADQELEACCEWLHWQNLATHPELIPSLRAARRPKPPSLKEQALDRCNDYIDPDGIIRRYETSSPVGYCGLPSRTPRQD
jgi:hypothetical protein